MKQALKLFLIITTSLLLVACNNNNTKITLDEKYDGKEFIPVTNNEVEELLNNKESFILFTYNNYCSFKVSCEEIFKNFMKENNISILSIPYEDFKNSSLHNTIKFAPSVIIIDNGEIIDYLDANSDEDLDRYQDTKKFTKWVEEYILID